MEILNAFGGWEGCHIYSYYLLSAETLERKPGRNLQVFKVPYDR